MALLPNPTAQQKKILSCEIPKGNSIKVKARAGTGKTTTFLHFGLCHPQDKILYMCFNNKAVSEAAEAFRKIGARNVTCSTVHGLARDIKARFESAGKFRTRIHLKDIKTELDTTHQMAWRVQSTLSRFYHSGDYEITHEHCCCRKEGENTIDTEREMLQALRSGVLRQAKRIWEKTRDINDPFPISFDGYLKIFQLEGHKLNYDYILVDECQDSNPLTIEILKTQAANTKIVMIGDSEQAIYGFRSAHNAMESWDSEQTFPLTESFRFGKHISRTANLLLKTFLKADEETIGLKEKDSLGEIPKGMPYTLIARTNAKLYEAALSAAALGKKVHFVGTKVENAWDPTVPYKFDDALDTYRLFANRKGEIRNPYFRNFENYEELVKIAKGQIEGENEDGQKIQGDKELEALCRLVDKHKDNLPHLLKKIVESCTKPADASILLSTVHRAKGLEWKRVKLTDDFTDLVVRDLEESPQGGVQEGPPRIAIAGEDADREEFNLLYVAVTRASERLEPCAQIIELLENPHLVSGLNPEEFGLTEAYEYEPSPDAPPEPEEEIPKDELRIPYAEKDLSKDLASAEGGRLLWNPARKTWTWKHPRNEPVPAALKKYLTAPSA